MRRVALWLGVLSLAGCPVPPQEPEQDADVADARDGGVQDGGPRVCPSVPSIPPGASADGHPDPLGASSMEARAGRLESTELPADPTGLATWKPGDFVLANDKIAILIEDVGPSDLYDPWGGRPVGIARVRGGRLVDAMDFNELMLGLGRFIPHTDSVTVVADGTGGGPATIRAIGDLEPLPFLDYVLQGPLPNDYSGYRVAIDYTLAPGRESIDVSMTVVKPTPGTTNLANKIFESFFQYKRTPAFRPVIGFSDEASSATQYIAFAKDGALGYLWEPVGGDLVGYLSTAGFQMNWGPPATAMGCVATRIPLARLVIGGPGVDGLLVARARDREEPFQEIRGRVLEADGAPASSGHVHAARGLFYLTRAEIGPDGTFAIHVPDGRPLELTAFRAGELASEAVSASVRSGTVALTMRPFGEVTVSAVEAPMSTPIPARVQITPVGFSAPSVPRTWGERVAPNGRMVTDFLGLRPSTFRLPVGRYRLTVSRGYEYELYTTMLDITAGARASITAPIERVVSTPGVLCADYHIHTWRSSDAEDPVELKVRGGAADGLEIMVRSDHDYVADFQDTVDALGYAPWVRGVPGDELTTFTWGHFGVFPLMARDARNAGAFEWTRRTPPEVFAEVRSRPERPALIINHPRAASVYGGYFEVAGFDTATGQIMRPTYWDDAFSLVEVFNPAFNPTNLGQNPVVQDWFRLLRMGRRVFAVGSSDSHEIVDLPIGYPRTCVRLATDDPRAVTGESLRDATNAGASTVSGGLYLDVVGPGGAGPGTTARGVGDMASLRVIVRGASWIDADRLLVVVDGQITQRIPISATPPDPRAPTVRLDTSISVPVQEGASGSFVIFIAQGDDPISIHTTSLTSDIPDFKPFAASNPIFLVR